jgi:hypothetical protein
VKDLLRELHGGSLREHLGFSKPLNKLRKLYEWLHTRRDVEKWFLQCDTCAAK